jgi:hypothetical protein
MRICTTSCPWGNELEARNHNVKNTRGAAVEASKKTHRVIRRVILIRRYSASSASSSDDGQQSHERSDGRLACVSM